LIGGPNQSHKVNFKERFLLEERVSKKNFFETIVNTFFRLFLKFSKSLGDFSQKEPAFLPPSTEPPVVVLTGRSAMGGGNMMFVELPTSFFFHSRTSVFLYNNKQRYTINRETCFSV